MNDKPGIDLRINGKGLLLSGNFKSWQSRLVLGPDLDDVGVSLFVDATSVGSDEDGDHLFSFRSRSVESLGKGRYRVIGDFTGVEATRELAVKVETPLGHTPLIALSFDAERKDFGDGFQALVDNATLFGSLGSGGSDGEEPHREAAGWLTVPNVAAA